MKTIVLETVAGPSSEHASSRADKVTLRDVSVRLSKSKKIVAVTGAGISCSSGIPDFRSEDGLYSLVKSRYPDRLISGKDLFSSSVLSSRETRPIFYTFISELSKACQSAHPTDTHKFLRKLVDKSKLLRVYTQNIDGLERRVGLYDKGKGKALDTKRPRVVELHGDIGRVRCVLCSVDYEMTEEWSLEFGQGRAPACPACQDRCHSRIRRNARSISVGTLRPAIVLYDEPHPRGDMIGETESFDISKSPDMLLIMGTSLKVHGLKALVKDFAKTVHATKVGKSSSGKNADQHGIVVYVNKTPPSREWTDYIDVYIQGETDAWVKKAEADWRAARPADWEVQSKLAVSEMQEKSSTRTAAKAAPATSTPKRAPLQASVSWDNALGVRSSPRHQRPITPADTASVCSPTKKRKRAAAVEDDDEWTPSPPKMRHG